MLKAAGYVRAASGLTCPPQQQAMAAVASEPRELDALVQQLAAKEATLVALSEEASAAEEALLAAMQQQQLLGGKLAAADDTLADQQQAACDGGAPPNWLAARWQLLAAQRAELALRWQCLLEDKRQLRAVAAGRGEQAVGAAWRLCMHAAKGCAHCYAAPCRLLRCRRRLGRL